MSSGKGRGPCKAALQTEGGGLGVRPSAWGGGASPRDALDVRPLRPSRILRPKGLMRGLSNYIIYK